MARWRAATFKGGVLQPFSRTALRHVLAPSSFVRLDSKQLVVHICRSGALACCGGTKHNLQGDSKSLVDALVKPPRKDAFAAIGHWALYHTKPKHSHRQTALWSLWKIMTGLDHNVSCEL